MIRKITFPHAGDYYIAFKFFFEKLGYETIIPPPTTAHTLNLGVKYSPSQACLPFKITLGNIIEALQNHHINLVGMVGGKTGMCRLAYYGELYKKILTDLDYDIELFVFKLNRELWETVKSHFPETKLRNFFRYFYGMWKRILMVELIRDSALKKRPTELVKGTSSKLYSHFMEKLQFCETDSDLLRLKKEIIHEFARIETDPTREVLKIGVVGEFFLLIDQFATMDMENFLGEQGVELSYSLSFSKFFMGSIKQLKILDKFLPTHRSKIINFAMPYINRPIGGHGRESIGEAIMYSKMGYKGVIQIYPFTCMPEIMAASVLPKASADHHIPILSLCLDEHTGTAGIHTRLEAFIDMIKMNRTTGNLSLTS